MDEELLDVSFGGLTELPHIPDTVKILSCENNNLVSLPPLPGGLKELICDRNQLESLPELPEGLVKLSCFYNNLRAIPTLPETLTDLDCGDNNCKSLVSLPPHLEILNCRNNAIISLPHLPPSLLILNCQYNMIAVLHSLPPDLIELNCAGNQFTSLPPLPPGLIKLNCESNQVTSLPPLPPNLKILKSSDNFLKTLPELPESLITLDIDIDYLEEPYKRFYEEYKQLIIGDDEDDDPNLIPHAIKVLREKIHSYLNGEGNMPQELWKGFTRSDVSKLDVIFGEKANDYAMCPVCLRYVQREDGCMYMKHNCTSMPGYYHGQLYNIYKTPEGNICWCTICGRISLGHRHYKPVFYKFKKYFIGRRSPSDLLPGGYPFESDCSITNGGGGLDEKLQRFRRYREYALDLQEDINEKTKEHALNELVEEVWNAPMRREKRVISKIRGEKKWNINESAFPPNAPPTNNRNSNAPNIPFDGEMPTKVNKGTNVVMMNDDVPIIEFHHRQHDGHVDNHGVAEATLEGFIQNTSPTDEAFGYCFAQPACNAKLHPEEIKPYVSDAIYKRYKKHFNIKFRVTSGGGKHNIVQEAKDAMCVIVKRGGRTRRGGAFFGKKLSKKTRKR